MIGSDETRNFTKLRDQLRPYWVDDLRLFSGVGGSGGGGATIANINTAIDAHRAESNPHAIYLTQAEGDVLYSLLGHTHDDRYYTEAESDARFLPLKGSAQYQIPVTGSTPFTATYTALSSFAGNGLVFGSSFAVGVANTGAVGLSIEADAVRLTSSSAPGAAASILASNASGGLTLATLTTTGAISGATNTNTAHTLGYATVGYVGFSGFAGFAANGFANTTGYALAQYNTDGTLYINSPTTVNIRNSGSQLAAFGSTGLVVESGKLVGSNGYVSGWAGSGWRADQNVSVSGQSFAEFDNLSIRGTLSVYELVINQIRATNGTLIVSSAGKIDSVSGSDWTFEDPNASSLCAFAVNDLVIIQSVDVNASTIVKRIVRRVSAVSGKTITVTAATGGPADTGTAVAGDTVVRFGNTSNAARQGVVLITSDMSNSPYQDVISGVTSWADWTGGTKTRVRMGHLSGITGTANEYGMIAGTGYTSSDSYAKFSTAGVVQNNVNSTWRSGGTTFLEIDSSSGVDITIPDDAPLYSRGYSFKNSGGTNISSLWAWYSTADSSNRLELFAEYAARKNMIDVIASSDSTHDADILLRAAGRSQQAEMSMSTSASGSSVNFIGITSLFSVDAPQVNFSDATTFLINSSVTSDTYLRFSSFTDTYIKSTYNVTGSLRYIDISAGATSRVRLGNGNGFSLEADSNTVDVNQKLTVSGGTELIKLNGSGTSGNASTGYIAFYDSNTTTRRGFIGDVSSANTDIYLRADTSALHLGDSTSGDVIVLSSGGTKILGNVGFYNTTPIAKQTVTGSRGGNAALASLLTALASHGLITDSTT